MKLPIAFIALFATQSIALADVPKADIATCAIIEGDLSRLSCYDNIAKTHNLDGPQNLTNETTDVGDWTVDVKVNPIDDSKTVVLALMAKSGKSKWGNTVSFVARCMSNSTDAYINWNDYLGSDARVLSRVGSEEASTEYWSMSTDSKSTFHPRPIEFLKKILSSNKLVAQVTPYNESPTTAVFDTTGLENAIKPLRETCSW